MFLTTNKYSLEGKENLLPFHSLHAKPNPTGQISSEQLSTMLLVLMHTVSGGPRKIVKSGQTLNTMTDYVNYVTNDH